jgi:hypothetical protein
MVIERKMVKLSEISGSLCAWEGCHASFKGGQAPSGWTYLILYRPPLVMNFIDILPTDCLRDTCLCPEHTRLLDSQFKELGRAVSGPAAGRT